MFESFGHHNAKLTLQSMLSRRNSPKTHNQPGGHSNLYTKPASPSQLAYRTSPNRKSLLSSPTPKSSHPSIRSRFIHSYPIKNSLISASPTKSSRSHIRHWDHKTKCQAQARRSPRTKSSTLSQRRTGSVLHKF